MGRFTEELARMARRELLKQLSGTDRMIRRYYIIAAKSIEKRLESAKTGSLTERWLDAYLKSIKSELDRLGGSIQGTITSAAQAAAEAQAAATNQWLERVAGDAGIALNQSFRETLTAAPTDALRAMIEGTLYSDGRRLSDRIWSETGRLEGNIQEIIAQGVAQQMDTIELARLLEAYVNPDKACPVSWHTLYPDIPFERKIDYNALRLARTSITHVFWATGKAAAKKNPLCTGMRWVLSDSHYERQVENWGEDVCDQYAKHDEGLGVGVWPIDKLPMPHPNCLCRQDEVLPELEDAAAMLGDWASGKANNPAMDVAFEKWQKENAKELNNWQGDAIGTQQTIDKGEESGTMEADIRVPRSLGAKYSDAEVRLPDGGMTKLTEGSRITHVRVIAGKNRNRQIDMIYSLLDKYGGKAEEWQKKKGIGYVDFNGESRKVELHWYEEADVGFVEAKVKEWIDE